MAWIGLACLESLRYTQSMRSCRPSLVFVLCAVLCIACGDTKGKTPKTKAQPGAPEQVGFAAPPSAAAKPAPLAVENSCVLKRASMKVAVAVDVEHLAMYKEASDGTRREYYSVSCTQCVDETHDYNRGTDKACKEFSWDCKGLFLDLDALDGGAPLSAKLHRVPTMTAVNGVEEINEYAARIREHVADPKRYKWVDEALRDRGKAFAARIESAVKELRPFQPVGPQKKYSDNREGVVFRMDRSNYIAVQEDKVLVIKDGYALGLGVANCAGETKAPN